MWSIYVLRDPEDGRVRYCGYAADVAARLRKHVRDARTGRERTRKADWIRALLARGVQPVVEVVERGTPGADWRERERWWIAHLRSIGAELTNATDGGEGVSGLTWRPEAAARLAAHAKIGHHRRRQRAKLREKYGAYPHNAFGQYQDASGRWRSPRGTARR